MRMRAAERAALKILIDAEYESEDAYIKALWDAVCGLLSARDSYGVGLRLGQSLRAYGPVYDLRQAKRHVGEWTGALSTVHAFVQPLNAPAGLILKDEPGTAVRVCPLCDHPRDVHDIGGPHGVGCIVGTIFPKTGKADYRRRCNCQG